MSCFNYELKLESHRLLLLGIDNSVSTHGGLVTFCLGKMTPKPCADLAGLELLLTDTCVGRNTRQLVTKVSKTRDTFPALVDKVLDAMDELSKAALDTIAETKESNQGFEKLEVNYVKEDNIPQGFFL